MFSRLSPLLLHVYMPSQLQNRLVISIIRMYTKKPSDRRYIIQQGRGIYSTRYHPILSLSHNKDLTRFKQTFACNGADRFLLL